MDLNDLNVVLVVAEELNFTKAAERLAYVQSNITSRVKKLEQELNVDLFIRHPRGVRLTSHGKILVEYARRIISLMEEASSVVSDQGEPTGRLSLGAVETLTTSSLVDVIATYHRKFPNVELTLSSGTSDYLKGAVSTGELDGAFITGPVNQDDLTDEQLWDDELLAIGINIESANPLEPWIVFNKGCSYRTALEDWLRSVGLTEPKFFVVSTLEALQRSVVLGLGNSVLPKSTIDRLQLHTSVHMRRLPGSFGKLSVHFVRRRESHMMSSLREFVNLLDERTEGHLL